MKNNFNVPEDVLWERIQKLIDSLVHCEKCPTLSNVGYYSTTLWPPHGEEKGRDPVSFSQHEQKVVKLTLGVDMDSFVKIRWKKDDEGNWFFYAQLFCVVDPECPKELPFHAITTKIHFMVGDELPAGNIVFPKSVADQPISRLNIFEGVRESIDTVVRQFYAELICSINRE